MERNAHRLTLHSPAREILPEWVESLLTSLKLYGVFVYRQPGKLLLLQPFTTMQP